MSIAKPQTPAGTYFEQFGVTEELRRQITTAALSMGGEDCDLYFQHSSSTSVALSDGKVNRASSSLDLGMGVRVVVGDQVGYSFSEDLSPGALIEAAKSAAQIANQTPGRSVEVERKIDIPNYYSFEQPWDSIDMAKRMQLVRNWEQAAFAADERVKRVEAYLADGATVVMIVRPDGRLVEDWRPMTTTSPLHGRRTWQNGTRFIQCCRRAGLEFLTEERQNRLARGNKASFISIKGILHLLEKCRLSWHLDLLQFYCDEAIGHGMEADFNRKKVSIFSSLMNKKVANEQVTIIDDGTILGSRGALNIDDEGNASQRTILVENGILKNYLHDEISSKHFNVAPTGSGRRQSFRHAPIPRMRATIMENGSHSPEEIISSIKREFYCSTFSNGCVSIGGGDFAFFVKSGYLIEDGRLTQPIKDANIIGNGPDALSKMDMIGNDMTLDEGGWTCGKDGQRSSCFSGDADGSCFESYSWRCFLIIPIRLQTYNKD